MIMYRWMLKHFHSRMHFHCVGKKDTIVFPARWKHMFHTYDKSHIDELMQVRRNSIANAPKLRLSCTNPFIWEINVIRQFLHFWMKMIAGLILGLHPTNDRHHYKVTQSPIGWAQTKNQLCDCIIVTKSIWGCHLDNLQWQPNNEHEKLSWQLW